LLAAQFGRLEALNLLETKGSDLLGKAQKQRKNALIYSAMNGHENIVEYLLNGKLIPVDL
jgi:ankyrin repeat protein